MRLSLFGRALRDPAFHPATDPRRLIFTRFGLPAVLYLFAVQLDSCRNQAISLIEGF
jgi:hypothetical protein